MSLFWTSCTFALTNFERDVFKRSRFNPVMNILLLYVHENVVTYAYRIFFRLIQSYFSLFHYRYCHYSSLAILFLLLQYFLLLKCARTRYTYLYNLNSFSLENPRKIGSVETVCKIVFLFEYRDHSDIKQHTENKNTCRPLLQKWHRISLNESLINKGLKSIREKEIFAFQIVIEKSC